MYFRCPVGINPERGSKAEVNSDGDGNLIIAKLYWNNVMTMKTFCSVMDIFLDPVEHRLCKVPDRTMDIPGDSFSENTMTTGTLHTQIYGCQLHCL